MIKSLLSVLLVTVALWATSFAKPIQNVNDAGPQLLLEVSKGNITGVRMLIEAGADINYKGRKNGVSPLQLASELGNLDLVKLILDAGADINQKNYLGITALHASILERRLEVFHYLRAKGAQLTVSSKGLTPIMLASAAGSNELVEILLKENEDINKAQPDGWTPLMHAAFFGRLETVKLLITRGADVRAVTKDGETAAQIASERGHTQIASYLIGIAN